MDDYHKRRDALMSKKGEEFAKRRDAALRKIEEEKNKRRKAYLAEREEERKRYEEEERRRREEEEEEERLEQGWSMTSLLLIFTDIFLQSESRRKNAGVQRKKLLQRSPNKQNAKPRRRLARLVANVRRSVTLRLSKRGYNNSVRRRLSNAEYSVLPSVNAVLLHLRRRPRHRVPLEMCGADLGLGPRRLLHLRALLRRCHLCGRRVLLGGISLLWVVLLLVEDGGRGRLLLLRGHQRLLRDRRVLLRLLPPLLRMMGSRLSRSLVCGVRVVVGGRNLCM